MTSSLGKLTVKPFVKFTLIGKRCDVDALVKKIQGDLYVKNDNTYNTISLTKTNPLFPRRHNQITIKEISNIIIISKGPYIGGECGDLIYSTFEYSYPWFSLNRWITAMIINSMFQDVRVMISVYCRSKSLNYEDYKYYNYN